MRPHLALLAVVVAAVALGCSVPTTTQGGGTRDEVVAGYLDALRRQDAGAMASLVGPGIDARSDIHAVMQADGGLELDGITVSHLDEFGGIYVIVTVAGKAIDGSTQELEVGIAKKDGRYFLALGAAVRSEPISNPESAPPIAP